jgi:hypothetical protein
LWEACEPVVGEVRQTPQCEAAAQGHMLRARDVSEYESRGGGGGRVCAETTKVPEGSAVAGFAG